jgi:hypothetical protein
MSSERTPGRRGQTNGEPGAAKHTQRQPRCRECQVPLTALESGVGTCQECRGESGLELDGYTFPDWE